MIGFIIAVKIFEIWLADRIINLLYNEFYRSRAAYFRSTGINSGRCCRARRKTLNQNSKQTSESFENSEVLILAFPAHFHPQLSEFQRVHFQDRAFTHEAAFHARRVQGAKREAAYRQIENIMVQSRF